MPRQAVGSGSTTTPYTCTGTGQIDSFGNDGANGSGGGAGGLIVLASSNSIVNSGSLIANGGDGGASNDYVGFGGGGAGGIIVLAAPSITEGTLSVEGGNTGAATAPGTIAQSPRAGGGGGGAFGGSGGAGARVTVANALVQDGSSAQAGHTVTIETDPTALL